MEPIILLHGALGSSGQLKGLAEALSTEYEVHLIDFSGHGSRPIPEEPFSIQLLMNDVLEYMQQQGLERVSIFGYSMGGFVAMYMAIHHPEKLHKIITLATKYVWDIATWTKVTQPLQPEQMKVQMPEYVAALAQEHYGGDWEQLVNRTVALLTTLSEKEHVPKTGLEAVNTPCLLMVGDKDRMVPMAETQQVYRLLPNAQMAVLPATPHALEKVDVSMLAYHIKRFIL